MYCPPPHIGATFQSKGTNTLIFVHCNLYQYGALFTLYVSICIVYNKYCVFVLYECVLGPHILHFHLFNNIDKIFFILREGVKNIHPKGVINFGGHFNP